MFILFFESCPRHLLTNTLKFCAVDISHHVMSLSIRRGRGRWGRGERRREWRFGAAVQLSERGRHERADGAACQAAQDEFKSAHSDWDPQHTTLVTHLTHFTHICCFKFNIMSSHSHVILCPLLVCKQMMFGHLVCVCARVCVCVCVCARARVCVCVCVVKGHVLGRAMLCCVLSRPGTTLLVWEEM